MTNEDFKVEIARQILEGHTCDSCGKKPCKFKTGKRYGTCRQWSEERLIDLKMKSYAFTASPRKLNVSWTSLSDLSLNSGINVDEILVDDQNGIVTMTAHVDDDMKKLIENNSPIGVSYNWYGDLEEWKKLK